MASEDIPVLTLILNELSDMRRENAEFRSEMLQAFKDFRAEMKQDMADMRRENSEFRREMLQTFNDFRAEMKQDMQEFKAEIIAITAKQGAKIDAFEAKTDKQFTAIQEQQTVIEARVIGLEHDTAGLVHWNYWILTLLVALIAAPQILTGIRALFGAVAEGVSTVLSAFRKGDKSSG